MKPDSSKVICPNCCHQFGAISERDQNELRDMTAMRDGFKAACDLRIDEVERLRAEAPYWAQLLKDCMAVPCIYPCLRDDLGGWLDAHGLKWPDEQQDEPTTEPTK